MVQSILTACSYEFIGAVASGKKEETRYGTVKTVLNIFSKHEVE